MKEGTDIPHAPDNAASSKNSWDDFFGAPGIDIGERDQPPEQKRLDLECATNDAPTPG